jgi:hypothetical protein
MAKVSAKLLRFLETLADAVADRVKVVEVEQASHVGPVKPFQEAPFQDLAATLIQPGQDGTQLFECRDGVVVGGVEVSQANLIRLFFHALAASQFIEPAVLGGLCQPAAQAGVDAFAPLPKLVPQLYHRALEGLFRIFWATAPLGQPRTYAGPHMHIQLIQRPVFLAFNVRTQLRNQNGVRISTLKQPHSL